MKLYREVKGSERQPEEKGFFKTDRGTLEFEDGKWHIECDPNEYYEVFISYWLEPIEITEEDIHYIANQYLIISESEKDSDYPYFTMKGAKAILSKLKGE